MKTVHFARLTGIETGVIEEKDLPKVEVPQRIVETPQVHEQPKQGSAKVPAPKPPKPPSPPKGGQTFTPEVKK